MKIEGMMPWLNEGEKLQRFQIEVLKISPERNVHISLKLAAQIENNCDIHRSVDIDFDTFSEAMEHVAWFAEAVKKGGCK